MRHIQVAVPVPQIDPLTYSVPDEFPDPIPGVRVLVPLGKRVLTGIVVSTPVPLPATGGSRLAAEPGNSGLSDRVASSQAPAANRQEIPLDPSRQSPVASRESIKPIIDILDSTPFLPPDVITLAMWVAEYY